MTVGPLALTLSVSDTFKCTYDTDAMGTVVGIEWPEGPSTNGQQPCGLHILLDDCRVGRMTSSSAEHLPTGVHAVMAASSFKETGKRKYGLAVLGSLNQFW